MNKLLVILFCICCCSLQAQKFSQETKVKKVDSNGFYNILLTPNITTHLKEDFSDIRIYDNEGKEVPFILRSEEAQIPQQLFKEYEIIENKSTPNCCTKIILHNPEKSTINNISLIIRNSDVRKKAKLSGSDNKTNWYIIKDGYNLESIYNTSKTSEVKIIDFPLSNYEYYLIDIADSNNAPLSILKAGYYDTYFEDGKYLSLPDPIIQQKDSSDKNSYITISFPSPQFIDKLKLEIDGPQYYLRNVIVRQPYVEKGKKFFNTIERSELRSNQENILYLNFIKLQEIQLVVENNDNQPLKVKAVKGSHLMHYLTANLEKGKAYTLRFGNPKVDYPKYDLTYFKDSIPSEVKILEPSEISTLAKEKKEEVTSKSFFNTTTWIWGAIIIVVIFLGYMSSKMLKEIKKD